MRVQERLQPAPGQELPSVPKMFLPGQPLDEGHDPMPHPGGPAPGVLEIENDDPTVPGQDPPGFGHHSRPDVWTLIMKGEGDSDSLETSTPERKMGRVGADEGNSGIPGGGVFQEAEVEVETDCNPPLPGDASALSARPATNVQKRIQSVPQDAAGYEPPRRAQERAQQQVKASTQSVHRAGHPLGEWDHCTAIRPVRSRGRKLSTRSAVMSFQRNVVW